MSKKHNYTRPVRVADKSDDELMTFPADRHVITPAQRELPSPAAALAELGQPLPSERVWLRLSAATVHARLRAATVQHEQREARARREAHQILTAAEGPAPTVQEDLQAVRRRPWDAPMATPVTQLPQPPAPMICGVSGLPDPLATLAWDAVVADAAATARSVWDRVRLPLAFTAWSIGCFLLGRLA